ncbi:MAG: division/cell wall cluster transcriptional repressor MraZ [Bacilli bacterium]|jgi:MraZ protein|nr:division/cell wall cluster transcriptional repressor MraZ [Bacilli bacterium]MDD4584374.1 division/cell wall cluster transcriptional repressor MraZ [Bacilli bacterium]
MFIGQYSHTIDDKSRLTIPAKFRDKIGSDAVMTIGFDECISIYTSLEWEKLQEKLLTLNTNSSDARKHLRMFAGSASDCLCDSHGRVIIPQNLLNHANINKDVVLVGTINHIEIWSKENWQKYEREALETFDEVAEKL